MSWNQSELLSLIIQASREFSLPTTLPYHFTLPLYPTKVVGAVSQIGYPVTPGYQMRVLILWSVTVIWGFCTHEAGILTTQYAFHDHVSMSSRGLISASIDFAGVKGSTLPFNPVTYRHD